MPKRGRDTLTGGTHDVNPQYMNIPITYTDSTTTGTVTTYVLPKSPITQNGRAQIIEILKIWATAGGTLAADATQDYSLAISTSNPTASVLPTLTDPRVLALFRVSSNLTTSGLIFNDMVMYRDLTDGAGHGVLVATDNLYVQMYVNGAATSGTTGSVKILYRYKNVSVQEYIGIVQSQN